MIELPVNETVAPRSDKSSLEFIMPYRFDSIDPSTTAMIVVDMQNDFVADGAMLQSKQAHALVPKLAQTLKFCREQGFALSTPPTYIARTAATWACTTICIRPSPIVLR